MGILYGREVGLEQGRGQRAEGNFEPWHWFEKGLGEGEAGVREACE